VAPTRPSTRDRHGPAPGGAPGAPDDTDPGSCPHADPESVARKILLDKLSAQPRTRHELAEVLARKLVPAEVAGPLLDRFEEVGLVDDAAFARAWVESRRAGRGLASRALAQELRRKGVADEIVEEALAEVDPDEEKATARALVQRKLRTMSRLDRQARLRRLSAMLARKGYPPGLATGVVREVLEAAGDETGDETGEETDGPFGATAER
jgi:regulatory protein